MPERLPQIKPQEAVRAFEQLGFIVRRQTGSHLILRHPATKNIVSIPIHSGDLKRGLLFGLIKHAGISPGEFLNAL